MWCMDQYWYDFAYKFNMAPPILLKATHEKMLDIIPLKELEKFSID